MLAYKIILPEAATQYYVDVVEQFTLQTEK
jgi:hypothetical protein